MFEKCWFPGPVARQWVLLWQPVVTELNDFIDKCSRSVCTSLCGTCVFALTLEALLFQSVSDSTHMSIVEQYVVAVCRCVNPEVMNRSVGSSNNVRKRSSMYKTGVGQWAAASAVQDSVQNNDGKQMHSSFHRSKRFHGVVGKGKMACCYITKTRKPFKCYSSRPLEISFWCLHCRLSLKVRQFFFILETVGNLHLQKNKFFQFSQ